MATEPPGGPSLELIIYQLGELKGITKEGLDKLERRQDSYDDRLSTFETWRAAVEERERLHALEIRREEREEGVTGPDWVKIVLGLLAALGAALTIAAQNGAG